MNCKINITVAILFLSLLLPYAAFAQNKVIKGIVLDVEGQPVIGAGIIGQGGQKSIGTTTDIDGRFSIEVPEEVMSLRISSLGMEPAEYMIPRNGDEENIRIILKYEEIILEQVVVTGYSQTTVKRITGSVGIISSDKFEGKPVSSVSALMQGELAGVQVTAVSGQPGTQSRIRIRGTNNLSGSSDPLWVVDGVPLQDEAPSLSYEEIATGGFDNIFVSGVGNINPNDIESITVLKDAAASAIYGSRAANGVIVVTTKRGQAGRMKVNYSNNFIWSFRPQRSLDLMNSEEKLAWEQELWDEVSAAGYETSLTDNPVIFPVIGVVGQIRAGVGDFTGMAGDTAAQDAYIESLKSIDTNWYDILFRNAFSQNHHLSLSGGSERYTYYISAGFNDDNGMLINNRYQRYNLTSNVTMQPSDFIKLDIGVDVARQSSLSPDSSVDPFTYAYFANPYEAPYDSSGNYTADRTYFSLGYYNGRGQEEVMPENGFSIMRELNSNYTETVNWANTVRGSVDIDIFGPLSFSGLASYSYSSNSTDKIVDKDTYTAFRDRLGNDDHSQTNLYGSITQNRAERSSYVLRGHFSFKDTFRDIHTLSVIAGAEIRGAGSNTIFTKRYNYDPVTGTTSMPQISGPQDEWLSEVERLNGEYFTRTRYASFYASADYYLRNDLVFNASFRTDGSSNFGSNRQFNPTWSAGAAWHMAEERWLKDNPVVSHMTLRLSYGYTGDVNTSTTHQLVMQYIQQSYRHYGDETYPLGTIPSAPNPNLGWERTQDMKAAFDFGLWDDRLSVNTEAYYRLSTDVVTSSQIMSTNGFSSVNFNSADIMNSGIETTVNGYMVRTRDWKVNASVNFAYNYNKVLKYRPSTYSGVTAKDRYVEGYPIGAILSGKYEGIDSESGLYMFRLRPDAEIKTASDLNKADNYRYYLGTTIAPFSGGFNISVSWKILRISVSGVYSFGSKAYDTIESPASYLNARHNGVSTETVQSQYSDLYSNHLNVNRDRTDRWTPDHTSGVKYPRIYDYYGTKYNFESYNPMDWNIVNAIYLKDISYMRIKSIILTCSLPEKWISKAKMTNVSINASLNNFITVTRYEGMDPEIPGATYPTTRSVSLGVNIGF